MAKKKSHITITDQFCGAGGSSQGAKKVLDRVGGEIKLALNHWKLAIETHNTNFPNTMHDCTDVSAADPRRYPSTDGLITSPECTTHSPAGGNNHKSLKKQMDMFSNGEIDPATQRSRATMWDVCRFAEYHLYNFIIVENVVEAKTRWPLFDVWLTAMHTLGYKHKCVYHNSMHHHPTPQSRDRMYVVFWKKGNKAPDLEHTPAAHCPKCEKDILSIQTWKKHNVQWGKYKQQYVYCCPVCSTTVDPYYYAAFNCIDWSNRGTRIGDRKIPLQDKTMKRIEFGRKKYALTPYLVQIAYNTTRGIARNITDPHYTQSTTTGQAIINPPFIVNNQHSTAIGFRVKGLNEITPTIQTIHQLNLVSPPYIVKLEHAQRIDNVKPVTDPLSVQTARQSMMVVTPPFITELHNNGDSRAITDPLNTATAGGVKNGIVTSESWQSFIAQYYGGSNCVTHITETLRTVTTGDRSALITYKEPSIEDFYYRMLKPGEVKLAMAFNSDYQVLGNSRDQVKQLGNAVTPPAMEWLVERCVESLN